MTSISNKTNMKRGQVGIRRLACNFPLVKRGNFPMICLAFSLRDRPQRALQAKARIESASVIGVLTDSKSINTMIPLCERTVSHT